MEENSKSVITVNTSLAKIEKQIAIGEKIINKTIEELFNKAFRLINSKKIDIDSNYNYLSDFLKDETLLDSEKFSFVVQNEEDYIQALELFDKIIELNGSFKLAYYFKGIVLQRIHLIEESINFISRAIEIDKEFIMAIVKRVELLEEKFEFDLALNDCNNLIIFKPDCAEFYHTRANVLFSLDKKIESINDYNISLELDNTNIRVYNNLGRTYKSLGNDKLAKENFNKAIRLVEENLIVDNKNAKFHYYIGYAKWQLDEFTTSLESLNKAIQINSDYESAINIRAIVNKELNNHIEAINDYKKYLELNPLDFITYNSLGFLYYQKTREFEKAKDCFTKAIDLNHSKSNPTYKNSHYFRSNVRKILGDVNGSNEDYMVYQKFETKN